MALVSALLAGAVATIPVAALGLINSMSGKSNTAPKRTSLLTQPDSKRATKAQNRNNTHPSTTSKPVMATQRPKTKKRSVLDDQKLFPTIASNDTKVDDFFRDPYTNQLYLCTEDEMPLPDTDVSYHPSAAASQRKLAVLNGLVGNEHIRRQEETTEHKNSWSNDPSPALLRSMNIAGERQRDAAFSRVSHFTHNDARPEGTGLIHRERFAANKIGYNWDNVWALRRNHVNRFNLRRESKSFDPSVHLSHTSNKRLHHAKKRPDIIDIGQLRKKRGNIDNISIADRKNTVTQRKGLQDGSLRPSGFVSLKQAGRDIYKMTSFGDAKRMYGDKTQGKNVVVKPNSRTTKARVSASNKQSHNNNKRGSHTHVFRSEKENRSATKTVSTVYNMKQRSEHNAPRRSGKNHDSSERGLNTNTYTHRPNAPRPKVKNDSGKGSLSLENRRPFLPNANAADPRVAQTSGFRSDNKPGHNPRLDTARYTADTSVPYQTTSGFRSDNRRLSVSRFKVFKGNSGEPVTQRSQFNIRDNSVETQHALENKGRGLVLGQDPRGAMRAPHVNLEMEGRTTTNNRMTHRSNTRQQTVSANVRIGGLPNQRKNLHNNMTKGQVGNARAAVTTSSRVGHMARVGNGVLQGNGTHVRALGRQNIRGSRSMFSRASISKPLPGKVSSKWTVASAKQDTTNKELRQPTTKFKPTSHVRRLSFEE